jgi:sensor histidine kinase YesM
MKLREAELNSLQAQINPHFLFNTIESIRMKALDDGDPDVARMLSKLGGIFRWSTRFNEKIVFLEDEIEYVSSYLELQSIRFNNSIDIDIRIDDKHLDNGIPKLILQPIIENAIMHGLFSGVKDAAIVVEAAERQGQLVLTVEDNGRGMKEPDLHALRERIKSGEPDEKHSIGLKNVHDRIRLLFGEPFGIEINSTYRCGMAVEIHIPYMKKETMQGIV